MPKLSKKELKALKKAKKEAAEREKARLEAERKARAKEVARQWLSKMKQLRKTLPRILKNPWLLFQEEDTGLEFIEAYSLAVRNSQFPHYHNNFPPQSLDAEEDKDIDWEVKAEEAKEKAEAEAATAAAVTAAAEAGAPVPVEAKKEEEKKEEPAGMPMAIVEEGKYTWDLRTPAEGFLQKGMVPLSRDGRTSQLQQVVNLCTEALMQVAEFAASQPGLTVPNSAHARQLALLAKYFAIRDDKDFVAEVLGEEEDMGDNDVLKTDAEHTIETEKTTTYGHKTVLNVILNLLKPTLDSATCRINMLEVTPQFYPPEQPKEEKKVEEPPAKGKKGKKDKKDKKKGKKDKKKDKKGKKKEEEKKEEEKKEEVKLEEEKKERPPLPDLIACEFVDHLFRYLTKIHPKAAQEEAKAAQEKAAEEAKKKAEAMAAAAAAAEENSDEDKPVKKKKSRKKSKEVAKKEKDPLLASLRIDTHLPVLVSALGALAKLAPEPRIAEYVAKHPMFRDFHKMATGEDFGFNEDYQALAQEVCERFPPLQAPAAAPEVDS